MTVSRVPLRFSPPSAQSPAKLRDPDLRRARPHPLSPASASPEPTPHSDWARIMDGVLRGDEAASRKLASLARAFVARSSSPELREEWADLEQDVIVAVIQAVHDGKVRDLRALPGYIKKVARFKVIDRMRWGSVRQESVTPSADEIDEPPDLRALTKSECTELCVDLRRALDRLPATQRSIAVAVYCEGMTYGEVAAKTGIPLGTVKHNLRRALRNLRNTLDPLPVAC